MTDLTNARNAEANQLYGAARGQATPVDISPVLDTIDQTLSPGVTRTASDPKSIRIVSDEGEFFVAEDNQIIVDWVNGGGMIADYVAPIVVPEMVSARQFKLQLLAAGLLDQVDGWVKTQDRSVQIAYEYSGSFVKSSPMMQEGFQAMGFTPQQIDDFFTGAAKL
ncbi:MULTISPECIES: hypothetical protein [Rhizobium]|uniref:Uncharacterized protein n=6 Tax=Rhizobium TaxID=379 RepID=A0A1C3X6Z8_9HYPH|nr:MULTISPECIES: hypothetical protein [Rhizobium]MBB4244556.1 hypothetical protein [Rhizobium tropici]MBB4569947.1 hypothetical protein [Rhizobium leucaenae]MBB5576147.1 hypothetical protein [Rhizobium paranaense]MBB5596033.1 hypothetical protein [Rhizobium tropici]MBB6489451.1 hypothetical protein [Rhizobium lusitanum]